MGYCGAVDVRRALTGSAQAGGPNSGQPPTNTAADLDDTTLQDSIEEASSTVDAYIDGPYVVGTDDIPKMVIFWTRDIAAYLATLVWRKAKPPATNDPVVLRYNHAMAMLQGVAEGTITLVGPANVEDQPTIVNLFPRGLFNQSDFNLHGSGEGSDSWPLLYHDGALWWSAAEVGFE